MTSRGGGWDKKVQVETNPMPKINEVVLKEEMFKGFKWTRESNSEDSKFPSFFDSTDSIMSSRGGGWDKKVQVESNPMPKINEKILKDDMFKDFKWQRNK